MWPKAARLERYNGARAPHFAAMRQKYLSAEKPPASTLLGVQALARPEFMIEIEMVAVV